jgi:PAS domain S-box-containing protein
VIFPASIDGGLMISVSLLLIENDQVDEMALTKAVAENALPYQITIARSVAEARQILAARSFDIILTDYSLADGTSFDLVEEFAGQVVIFITGSGNEEVAAQALHLGAEDYLIKDPQRNYLKLLPYRVATALQQVRVTRELSASEQRFRAMFEQAAVGTAQIDTMTGRFVRVNQKYTDIIGYAAVEMLALDFQSLTYPDDLEADLANMERLKSGEIREFEMEKRLFHENGRVIWVKLTVSAMWAPGATESSLNKIDTRLSQLIFIHCWRHVV